MAPFIFAAVAERAMSIGKTAPFAMMGCFNLAIVTWALYVYLTQD
jgi:hypothetical protein